MESSKFEGLEAEIYFIESDLLSLLRDTFDSFVPLAANRSQQLVWDSDLTTLECINDREVVEKVVFKLLSIALKFTPKRGTVTLSVRQIPTNDSWQLIVSDTGIGIATAHLSYIFNRLYKADVGTEDSLALVEKLTTLVEGSIEMKSTLGEGGAFILTFPRVPMIANHLVTLRLILRHKGYEMLEATEGTGWVKKTHEDLPAAMMPEKEGHQLAEELLGNVHQLLEIPMRGKRTDLTQLSPPDVAFVERIYQYLADNIQSDQLLVEDLTKEFALSRSQLFRKIKLLTSTTPAQLIRDFRLDKAYHLLKQSPTMRVFDVMFAVGFNDAKHFSYIFKKRFGVSPQTLKK